MMPQYQFNLGYDPLLDPYAAPNPEVYSMQLEQRMQQLAEMKKALDAKQNVTQPVNNTNLWDELDKELSTLNNDQKSILAQDKTYIALEQELQLLVQKELINSVKNKISNSPKGKEIIEKQLNNIRSKKEQIIAQSDKEAKIFKLFQQATQANPNLTYAEFIKSLNENGNV